MMSYLTPTLFQVANKNEETTSNENTNIMKSLDLSELNHLINRLEIIESDYEHIATKYNLKNLGDKDKMYF